MVLYLSLFFTREKEWGEGKPLRYDFSTFFWIRRLNPDIVNFLLSC
jgi:hypothetical protein